MKKSFIVFVILLFPMFYIVGPIRAASSYPEVLETNLPFENIFYNFTASNNNITVQRIFNMSEFRDVTFADILIEQAGQLISNITLTAQINRVNATNTHIESNLFDQEKILFVLDDRAMLLAKDSNVLLLSIKVSFRKPNAWDGFQHKWYTIRFDAITIKTAYRQNVQAINSQLNQTNNAFTALIIDPSYQIATQGVIFANKSNVYSLYAYQLIFYIIVPKNMKSNYYLNVSFTFDQGFSLRSINIDQFGLISSSTTSAGISYTFRYISNNPSNQSLVEGMLQFNPKNEGMYHIGITGNFFITNNYKIFPGSPDMDLFLFINATLIIPLAVLSKLIYRRLFY